MTECSVLPSLSADSGFDAPHPPPLPAHRSRDPTAPATTATTSPSARLPRPTLPSCEPQTMAGAARKDPFEHRHYLALHPTCNKLLAKRWEDHSRDLHCRRLKQAKPTIDNSQPRAYPHLEMRLKRWQIEEERLHNIEKNNHILLDRITFQMLSTSEISNLTEKEIRSPTFLVAGEHKRKRNLQRIMKENLTILQRIEDKEPNYNQMEWLEDRQRNLGYLFNISQFPRHYEQLRKQGEAALKELHAQSLYVIPPRTGGDGGEHGSGAGARGGGGGGGGERRKKKKAAKKPAAHTAVDAGKDAHAEAGSRDPAAPALARPADARARHQQQQQQQQQSPSPPPPPPPAAFISPPAAVSPRPASAAASSATPAPLPALQRVSAVPGSRPLSAAHRVLPAAAAAAAAASASSPPPPPPSQQAAAPGSAETPYPPPPADDDAHERAPEAAVAAAAAATAVAKDDGGAEAPWADDGDDGGPAFPVAAALEDRPDGGGGGGGGGDGGCETAGEGEAPVEAAAVAAAEVEEGIEGAEGGAGEDQTDAVAEVNAAATATVMVENGVGESGESSDGEGRVGDEGQYDTDQFDPDAGADGDGELGSGGPEPETDEAAAESDHEPTALDI
ncbi:KIAA1430-like protein-domain-containing protein [Zopfochytrium polystomum]|nr:KIAA1430-like protein-domain-containing protein [Zopfochytrium polystomum]